MGEGVEGHVLKTFSYQSTIFSWLQTPTVTKVFPLLGCVRPRQPFEQLYQSY